MRLLPPLMQAWVVRGAAAVGGGAAAGRRSCTSHSRRCRRCCSTQLGSDGGIGRSFNAAQQAYNCMADYLKAVAKRIQQAKLHGTRVACHSNGGAALAEREVEVWLRGTDLPAWRG